MNPILKNLEKLYMSELLDVQLGHPVNQKKVDEMLCLFRIFYVSNSVESPTRELIKILDKYGV